MHNYYGELQTKRLTSTCYITVHVTNRIANFFWRKITRHQPLDNLLQSLQSNRPLLAHTHNGETLPTNIYNFNERTISLKTYH